MTDRTVQTKSDMIHRLKPRHASIATQSETAQMQKLVAQRQSQQALRRRLPITQQQYQAIQRAR